MFCPKCGREYGEDYRACPHCGDEFVEVFSTYHQDDISFLKSILDGEDITYFFQGESSIMLIAAGAYARLLVKAEDAERVKEILRDLGFLESRAL